MADRILALERGVVRQIGRTDELYGEPADLHIAWLTGPISVVAAAVEPDADGFWLCADGFRIRAWAPALERVRGRGVKLGLRLEHLRVNPKSETRATVAALSIESGREVTRVRVGGELLAMSLQPLAPGDEIGIDFTGCLVFAESGELLAAVG